jgi:branched-chain amino acid transport system permease protein
VTARIPAAGAAPKVSTSLAGGRLLRYVALGLAAAGVAFVVVWILFIARGTTFGSAVEDPRSFVIAVLDGLTLAGLYFIVASGFTLIFGLMRVVNMAHGAFFLLGGYIALELQRKMVGGAGGGALGGGLSASDVSLVNWIVPMLIAALAIGVIGVGTQQVLLRWNQGQELRQALITIAIAVIAADQMLAHFSGIAKDIAFAGALDRFVNLRILDIQYSAFRLALVGLSVGVGLLLWRWLKRTRMGMVIRAGVDDRQMVSALGVNIQLTFAIAFFVGSALAGFGGAIGGSFASLAPGVDTGFLLNSLVVVIVGGMGSLGGAVVGSLLFGLTNTLAVTYLPSDYSYYSIIFTFVLLALVLAFRPYGFFGRPA